MADVFEDHHGLALSLVRERLFILIGRTPHLDWMIWLKAQGGRRDDAATDGRGLGHDAP
jgi:hypothetical protein